MKLAYVPPSAAPNDCNNVATRNPIFTGNGGISIAKRRQLADLDYFFNCQLNRWVFFSAKFWGLKTPLADGILHIVGRRAKEKVIGAHAGWNVALMEHMNVVRNSSEVDQPRGAMGTNRAARFTAARRQPNAPITTSAIVRACPQPASISLHNELPKAIPQGCRLDWPVTTVRTVTAAILPIISTKGEEFAPAF